MGGHLSCSDALQPYSRVSVRVSVVSLVVMQICRWRSAEATVRRPGAHTVYAFGRCNTRVMEQLDRASSSSSSSLKAATSHHRSPPPPPRRTYTCTAANADRLATAATSTACWATAEQSTPSHPDHTQRPTTHRCRTNPACTNTHARTRLSLSTSSARARCMMDSRGQSRDSSDRPSHARFCVSPITCMSEYIIIRLWRAVTQLWRIWRVLTPVTMWGSTSKLVHRRRTNERLTPQTGNGGGVIYLRLGGLCKISPSFQLNVTEYAACSCNYSYTYKKKIDRHHLVYYRRPFSQ